MKFAHKILAALTAIALATAVAPLSSLAQTPATNAPPPASEGSFFGSVVGYFSAFNTNLDSTFGATRGQVWTGVDSIQGQGANLANSIGVSYDLFRSKPDASNPTNWYGNIGVDVESVTRNGGVSGTLISEGIGAGVTFVVHDVKLTGYLQGVYNFDGSGAEHKACVEFGLRVVKALTAHTFAGVGIGVQAPGNRQILSAIVGFTF